MKLRKQLTGGGRAVVLIEYNASSRVLNALKPANVDLCGTIKYGVGIVQTSLNERGGNSLGHVGGKRAPDVTQGPDMIESRLTDRRDVVGKSEIIVQCYTKSFDMTG